jgi:hypothetical protein
MLRHNTVFVVGAGASKEFGLPVGSELAAEISKKLDINFDRFGREVLSGDGELFEDMRSVPAAT